MMSERHEHSVRSLLEASRAGGDDALVYFAEDAVYHVNAWNEPLVGVGAIAAEFERQHNLWSNLRTELVNIGSAGDVVLIERIDTVTMMGRDVRIHTVGVFEFGDDGKITSWREYFDMKEIEAQLTG
jgi:limonene-1,2-epoxide hydrolase